MKPPPLHIRRAAEVMQAAGKLTPEASHALRLASRLYHESPQHNANHWLAVQLEKNRNQLTELKRKLNNEPPPQARPAV